MIKNMWKAGLVGLLALAVQTGTGYAQTTTSPAISAAAPAKAAPTAPTTLPSVGPVASQPLTNSLGVKFVPAGTDGVLFSVWDVRVKDFKAFVDATGYDATAKMISLDSDGWKARGDSWKSPGFAQTDDCPVVGVNLNDAKAFCVWLTKKEQAEGKLGANQMYRVPYDAEWSRAVGLSESSEGTPQSKNLSKSAEMVYPWGKEWPPPKGAGNYAGSEAKDAKWFSRDLTIKGYDDGYPRTSPVGSFPANSYGLYDMGGNVWQWCDDKYTNRGAYFQCMVQRGGSWMNYNSEYLLSIFRNYISADCRTSCFGMRVVVVSITAIEKLVINTPANLKFETTAQMVDFSVQALPTGHVDLSGIEWYVNGAKQTGSTTKPVQPDPTGTTEFHFKPIKSGTYTVQARAGQAASEERVIVFTEGVPKLP